MRQIIIFGCGYLGRRLALAHLSRGDRVLGVVRTPASVAQLAKEGIKAQIMDLDGLAAWPATNLGAGIEQAHLYYLIPPPRAGLVDSRSQALLARLPHLERVVLASTTGVYGDCAGAWVNESHPPNPIEPRAQRRLAAEQSWRSWAEAHGAALITLRLPGFYGPGRLPVQRLEQGLPVLTETASPWSNRIHIADLTMAAMAAMDQGRAGEVYNLSDGHPSTMTDYFNQVADHLGLPRPPQISLAEMPGQLSAGMQGYLRESRRIDNTKMLCELGVVLSYPTLAQGLGSVHR
jgi:nucleoside-diphosphate-sugar epimerase